MIICNTKLSDHAKRYSECKQIHHLGWSAPPDRSLQILIEEKKLYPVTYIRGIDSITRQKLGAAGIVTLKQLLKGNSTMLGRKIGLSAKSLSLVRDQAKAILSV